MKVAVDIFETSVAGDYGDVPGVIATCQKCGYQVEVFGDEDPSKYRACVMLREECPQGEQNFYEF